MIRHLHGFNLEFNGPPAILEAVAARLYLLPGRVDGAQNLRFDYLSVHEPSSHPSLRPEGIGRSFYEPSSGEATYWAHQDSCYLELDHRARALCHAGDGLCTISLLGPEISARWVAAHPLLTLPLLEMLKRRGTFFVHAAAFASHGRCILLPGSSGSGKSTLSAALLQSGLAYMSDDITFLKREAGGEARLLAFPEPVGLSAGATAFFPDLSDRLEGPAEPGYPKHEIELSSLSRHSPCGPSICWEARPAALLFPTVARTDVSVIRRISSDEALSLLAPDLLLTEKTSTQAHLDALAALARQVPAMRLHTGRDLDRVAVMCQDFLA